MFGTLAAHAPDDEPAAENEEQGTKDVLSADEFETHHEACDADYRAAPEDNAAGHDGNKDEPCDEQRQRVSADLDDCGMAVDDVPGPDKAEREDRSGHAEPVFALVEAHGERL
ncbi:MAG TPA: hypothetical protein VED84_04895 [Acidimicrobiales bacterium]|nr:hypothetical protein [Acidimicrobiales bacterium]